MNERIRELVKQATEHDYTTWDSYNQKELIYYKFNQEKFAELIVRECIGWIDGSPSTDAGQLVLTKSFIIANIKEHFGVEE